MIALDGRTQMTRLEKGKGAEVAAYCRYLDMEWRDVNSPLLTLVYPNNAVHCCNHPNATHMSVTAGPQDKLTDAVKILDKRPGDVIYTTSLCLPPIYGNESKWLMLAEMVEHYRLQGLDHFYLYVKEIDDYSKKLLLSYEADGDAELIYFKADIKGAHLQYAGIQVWGGMQQSPVHDDRMSVQCSRYPTSLPGGYPNLKGARAPASLANHPAMMLDNHP
ncbi:unnamed protein product [Cylicostephanus goldi]|uniref:Glycosyltransferase family 92 protein n=1 Tax=Cylicostephanus goldi TaxID=71465 RepID=A0A3P6SJ43_CYLGO|nr:unnamed protein product [Cylicostephanus goldi]